MFSKFALLLILCGVWVGSASDVVEGHQGNFNEVTKSGFVLVEFYAPWCGHCKKLAPEWEKAATALKGAGVTLVKVDATAESTLASQFNVRGYPTIKVFRDGEASDYEGGRTADAIVSYCRKRLGPAVTPLTSQSEINTFKSTNAVAIIAFMANKDDSFAQFDKLAAKHRDTHNFGVVSNPEYYEGAAEGSVVLFKQFDDLSVVYKDAISDTEAFNSFLKKESFRLLDEISPENYRSYVDRGLPILWLFIDPSEKEETETAKKAAAEVAQSFKGIISFVHLDGVRYIQMAQKMGLTGKNFPCVGVDHEGKHFAFPETTEVTTVPLKEWVEKFVAGTLARTVKSQPVPDTPTVDGLTTVVGDTFESIVLKSNKDVLIEFYAPWCGHCKQLAPIYKKLAAALKNVPTLTIAQMDATSNDPTGPFDIQGFPTLFFVPAGKDPMQYDGERTAVEMLRFIKKHATTAIDVQEKDISDEL